MATLPIKSDINVDGLITTKTFAATGFLDQASEATALMINGSGVVGTRELGTNAFNSTAFGTVTSVSAGNGMNFTTITGSGSIVLGTPGTISGSTTNSVTSNSHTHDVTSGIANTNLVSINSTSVVAGEYARFTAAGLESRSAAEVLSDIGAQASGNYLLDTTDTFTGELTVASGHIKMNTGLTSYGITNTVNSRRMFFAGGSTTSPTVGGMVVCAGIDYAGTGNGGYVYAVASSGKAVYLEGATVDVMLGQLNVGASDSVAGLAHVYGNATTTGGEVRIYNGGTYDTTIDYWRVHSSGGTLRLASNGADAGSISLSASTSAIYNPSGTGYMVLGATSTYISDPNDQVAFRVTGDHSSNTGLVVFGGVDETAYCEMRQSTSTFKVFGAAVATSTMTATNFILSSDKRVKTKIKTLKPKRITTDWKSFELKSDKGQKRYGVIAQELEKEHPEFIRTDAEGMKSVAYIDLLVAKMAELEARIKELEK